MPDEAGFAAFGCGAHGLNRMDLIGPEEKDFLFLIIEHGILCHHLVGFRDLQHIPGKVQVMADRPVFRIQPPGDEFPVQFRIPGRCKILCVHGIAHNEHLHIGEYPPELAFRDILFDLAVGVHVGVFFVLELYMDQRDAVDQQGHVKPAVPVIFLRLKRLVLVDNLINAGAPSDMFVVQDDKMDLLVAPLDVDIHAPILTHKPFSGVIE